MASPSTDRRLGLTGGTAFKAPVACATSGNITLTGEQSIDGVTTASSRVLVKSQSISSQNGIYDSDTGTWTRSADFDGTYDAVQGTLVYVVGGSTSGGIVYQLTTVSPVIGTSNLTFTQGLFSGLGGVSFLQAGTGAVSRTAQSKLRDVVSLADFMTADELTAYQTNNYSGAVTNVTSAVQAAMNAGSVYFPLGGVARITSSLVGISNTLLTGPGGIDTNTMYAAGKTAAIQIDGVDNFVIDGLGFNSAQLATNETALFLKNTTTPCTNIAVRNCQFTNIKIIKSSQSEHNSGSGYLYSYYATASRRHSKIQVLNNRCTKPASGLDNQGYAVYLFFCDKVVVANNITEDTFGLCFLWNGYPGDANWLVTYQYGQGHVVSNNTSFGVNNAVVLVGCKDSIVNGNAITATTSAGEILDCEGGRDVTISNNTVTGGQSILTTFFTNNNVIFENNNCYADTYVGGGSGNGIYQCSTALTDPDLANSGRVVLRNNNFISSVGEAYVNIGWCKDMVVDGNRLSNVTIYSNSGTNSLVIRDNTLDFTISPTFRPCIVAGKGTTANWTAATRSPRPKIQIARNTVEPNLAGGVIAVGIFLESCVVETDYDIFDNRLDNTTGYSFVIETGGGVRRVITFRNNALKSATPFLANAPIANDLMLWKDNTDVLSAIDAFGAIAGAPATNLTVDAKAITNSGSIIWNNAPGGATNVGWVYDSSGTTWRTFGVTY